jgi:hypothetical protein
MSDRWRSIGPALTLVVLAPLVGEVLSGSTRLSFIFVLVPEMMVWGAGTLIIRELARRWRGGWTTMLLLGLALAIAEEFVIQQTSLAPLAWPGARQSYGRMWGVTWPYFLFMLGYETVWIVLVPIQLTELVFSSNRGLPWLRWRGLTIAGVTFLIGSLVAWFLWTQRARPLIFHVPIYHPPATTVALGVAAIAVLVLLARAAPWWRSTRAWPTPRPWLVALTVLPLGFPWYLLMALVFGATAAPPLWLVVSMAAAWATMALVVIGRWALDPRWEDRHRWALALAALLVCMLAGFLGSSAWSRQDTVAKAVLNLLAVGSMVLLRARIARRRQPAFLAQRGTARPGGVGRGDLM